MKIGQGVKELPEEHNWPQEKAARRLRITQSYYCDLESGKYIPVKPPTIDKLIAKISEVYNIKESILKERMGFGFAPIRQLATHRIPILNEIPAGMLNDIGDYDFPPGIAEDYVDNYLKDFTTADPSTYALRVAGDCMEPYLQKGDIVLLSKTKQWESGDTVAVSWDDESKKELQRIYRKDNHIVLKSENPKHDPVVLEKNDGPKIMGVYVMSIRIPRR